MKEIWKNCKGYEGKYQVSNMGRIWSVKSQKYLAGNYNKDGYRKVILIAKNGKRKTETVHRLVAIAFVDNPNGYPVVNHIDSDRQNNNASNLEWTTVKGNTQHGYKFGSIKESQIKATEAAKLKNTKTYEIYKDGEKIGVYYGLKEVASAIGCNEKTIRNCLKENRATRNGYSFVCLGVI